MANVFEIKVKINEESELYEPLNPDKELSPDITDYLERQIMDRNIGENVLIHVISKEPLSEENVKTAFWDWIHGIESSALWEAAAIWIVEGPANRIRKRVLKNMAKGVEFQFETE